MYQKPQSCEVQFLRYRVRIFLSFWAIFCPFNPLPPNNSENQNFEKMKKASGDVIIFKLRQQKTQAHDVYLLRYGMWQTIFSHFRSFFALLPHYWPQKLKFGKNVKKHLEILSFYICVPLIKITWCMVPKIRSATDRIFLSSCVIFCHFTLLTSLKMNLHKCNKNHDHPLYCLRDMVHDR